MDSQTYHFQDLDTIVDQVHALFEVWEAEHLPAAMDVGLLYQTKLAVHEWLANLVQHANFETEVSDIALTIQPVQERICCIIEDNSDGFVLDTHLEIEPDYLDSLPERGMGLLILKICTEDLTYQRSELGGYNRLQFYVSADHSADEDSWTPIPYS